MHKMNNPGQISEPDDSIENLNKINITSSLSGENINLQVPLSVENLDLNKDKQICEKNQIHQIHEISESESESQTETLTKPVCSSDGSEISVELQALAQLKSSGELESSNDEIERTPLVSSMENMNNENREMELDKPVDDEYSAHVHYDDNGKAIYTDPSSKHQYEWCHDKNEWIPISNDSDLENQTSNENPFENEHYLWDSEKNEWIPKETKYYKWSTETNKWIPKVLGSDTTDVKCNYDEKDGTYTYTDKDDITFFWDAEKHAWFPKIDDDFMAHYQMNYGFIDNTSESSDKNQKKTATADVSESDDTIDVTIDGDVCVEGGSMAQISKAVKRKMPPEPPKWFEVKPENNTKVYVSKLPFDTTEDEFIALMSKYGMIMKDPETQKLKIKLYRDEKGELKGDGLCHYIKVNEFYLF